MPRRLTAWCAALAVLLMAAAPCVSATPTACQPYRYADGDTFTFLSDDGEKTTVRVAGFDAPERGQAWGRRATQLMRSLTEDGASCDCYKLDRYRRSVCTVRTLEGVNVAELMLREGLGCIDPRYEGEAHPDDRAAARAALTEALGEHRGMWGDPDPVCPADYRKRTKTQP